MDQLPNHKIPRLGTPGERYRDIQIIRQLPKQDLSIEFCKMLRTDVEKKEYNIFRELRDSIAMDIGFAKESPILTVSFFFSSGKSYVYHLFTSKQYLWHRLLIVVPFFHKPMNISEVLFYIQNKSFIVVTNPKNSINFITNNIQLWTFKSVYMMWYWLTMKILTDIFRSLGQYFHSKSISHHIHWLKSP